MKRSIVAVAAILIAALFISCSDSMNTPPVIIGGGNSGTSVSSVEDIQEALANGASKIRLAGDIEVTEPLTISSGVTIDGNGKTVKVSKPQSENTALFRVSGDGVVLSNMTFEFISDGVVGYSADETPAEPAEPTIDADEQGFILLVTGKNVTLNKVTLKTNNATAGINVYQAENVTINDLVVDECLKAPINISGSTNVVINGLTANGSSWYKGLNIVQVNGIGGIAQPSTVRIANASGIDAVWQEVVAADYNAAGSINSITAEGQSSVTLDGGVSLLIDDTKSKGWMIVPGENLLNIGNKGFTADDGEVKGNYAVLTDGYYNGSYANTDIRDIEEGSLNMGGNQAQNGIGFYFGTSSSITYDWNNSTQTFKNVVKPGEVYLMQMSFSGNSSADNKLVVGGNVQAKDNQPGAGGSGTETISDESGDVSVIMVVGADGVTYLVDLQSTTPIPVSGKDYRCGFVAWGDCLVNSIRVDKLNLDVSKLAGLMGN